MAASYGFDNSELSIQKLEDQCDEIFKSFACDSDLDADKVLPENIGEVSMLGFAYLLLQSSACAEDFGLKIRLLAACSNTLGELKGQATSSQNSTAVVVGKMKDWIVSTRNDERDLDETRLVSSFFASIGSKGGKARHQPMRKLENKMLELAKEKYGSDVLAWPSPPQMALDMEDEATARSKEYGANITPTNTRRALADWFRAYKKEILATRKIT